MSVIIGGAFAGLGGSYIALVTTGSSEDIAAGQGWIALSRNLRQMETFWIVLGLLFTEWSMQLH